MAITERPTDISADQSEQLRRAFEDGPTGFELLRNVRTRRVGLGYRIDSGTSEAHPATGRQMSQTEGPMKFVSAKEPVRLTEVEEALLAWAACGPNGIAAWDISLGGGYHELVDTAGRTASQPGNAMSHDLLIINDDGAFIYNPGLHRNAIVEMQEEVDRGRYDRVLEWYRTGCVQILDERPDVDYAVRAPGAPNATLFGPYQYNINRPGTTWFIPITDAAKLFSALFNTFDAWHMYQIDEWNGGRPAGVERWIGEGMLELPLTISALEQFIMTVECYPPGIMVQNIKLGAEALGLGHWNFCGFNPDVLFGALPEATRGLGFHVEPLNARAPISTGQLKVYGIEGAKTATYVPSPRYPTAESLINQWWEEKYGPGAWGYEGDDNLMRKGQAGYKPEVTDAIIRDPQARPAPWVRDAVTAYVQYCVDNFGQFPVTYNPMQAHFGVIVHHLDLDFYEQNYRDGYINHRHRNHFQNWHSGAPSGDGGVPAEPLREF